MSYNNDRVVAKLWEVIGWLRYSPVVGSTAQKCELELRRIVADLAEDLRKERSEHKSVPFHTLPQAEQDRIVARVNADLPPYEETARPSCNLENPEHCEACE